jgi:hypothetical protein
MPKRHILARVAVSSVWSMMISLLCAVPGSRPALAGAAQAPALTKGAPAAANTAQGTTLANPQQVQQLFLQGSVSGEDLKQALLAVKAAAGNHDEAALAAIIGPASAQMAAASTHGFFAELGGKLKELAGDLVRQKTVSYSDKVLNDFLTALTGDDDDLRKENVILPPPSNMTLVQQQSVLVMAALLVGSRIAHHTLDAAHRDFSSLEGEYTALLNKRQAQAAMLAGVLEKRRQAVAAHDDAGVRQMNTDLGLSSPEDLKFVDSFGTDAPLPEVADDLGMQNLSIQLMERRDPGGYAQYREAAKGLIGRSHDYLRATTDVAAFGAFSLAFMQEIVKTAQDKNMNQVFAKLPFAGDYIKESVPLIRLSSEAPFTGLVAEPNSLKHHYRLTQGQKSVDVKDADAVFGALNRSKQAIYFSEALFRNETPGLIYHLYLCEPSAAGAMIDHVVKPELRKSFAEQYLRLPDGSTFSFADALNDDVKTPSGQKLAELLLSKDYRIGTEAPAIGEVQRQTVAAYAKWNTTDLTRLVLANSQGVYAQLPVGDTVIRVIPSMATIYAYESYADSCGPNAKHETATPDATDATAPKESKKKPAKPKKPTPKPPDLSI